MSLKTPLIKNIRLLSLKIQHVNVADFLTSTERWTLKKLEGSQIDQRATHQPDILVSAIKVTLNIFD
jgi:hypothetical protein